METPSASPTLWGENPQVICIYPEEMESKLSFGISFVLKQQKHMNKLSCCQWYKAWWCSYTVAVMQ